MARFLHPDIQERNYPGNEFQPGDVVIVNNKYSHYAGEIQIILLPIENDETRNLIEHLVENEDMVLENIHDHDVVVFIEQQN